jgi:hypothetical protein
VDHENVFKKWSFSTPARNEMKCLYTRPITFLFVCFFNAS